MDQSQDSRRPAQRQDVARRPQQQDKDPQGDVRPSGRATTGNLSAENPRSWKPARNPHAGENIATRKAEEEGIASEQDLSGRSPQRADSGGTPQAFDEADDGLQPENGRSAGETGGPVPSRR